MIHFYHNACCRGASYAVVCAYRLNAVGGNCSDGFSPQWPLGGGKAFDPTWRASPESIQGDSGQGLRGGAYVDVELSLVCGMFGIRVNVEVTRVLVLVTVRVRARVSVSVRGRCRVGD